MLQVRIPKAALPQPKKIRITPGAPERRRSRGGRTQISPGPLPGCRRAWNRHGGGSKRPPGIARERRQQDGRQQEDSGLPWIPEGSYNAFPIHVAAGGGFTGLGSFGIRNVPDGFLAAVRYLVEEHGIDVNTRDSWGYPPMHYAASR